MSIQFICEHDGFEAWSNMPREKQRLLDLIRETRAEGVIFLSGDSHHGELHLGEHEGLYQLWEVTSSSLNAALPASENQTRVGPACEVDNFGLVTIDWKKRAVTLQVIGEDKNHIRFYRGCFSGHRGYKTEGERCEREEMTLHNLLVI